MPGARDAPGNRQCCGQRNICPAMCFAMQRAERMDTVTGGHGRTVLCFSRILPEGFYWQNPAAEGGQNQEARALTGVLADAPGL